MSVTDSLTGLYNRRRTDDVLVQLAGLLKKNMRATDIVSRWGGEEFLVIVSDLDIDETFVFADKLRNIIGDYKFPTVGQVTINCGVAQYADKETSSNLISRADNALYEAKKSGKNNL